MKAAASIPAALLALAALQLAGPSRYSEASGQAPSAPDLPPGYELVLDESFSDRAALGRLAMTDENAWRLGDDSSEPYLELHAASRYQPPRRSPLNIALIRDLEVRDFVLEVQVKQTGREYGHRDLCFFFGFESPERFYYVHLATTPDPNAHNIFLVDRAARRPTAPIGDDGVQWGTDEWHTVRIARREDKITVWFDGEEILKSTDSSLGAGLLGLGSFDDTGRFAALRVWAPETFPAGRTQPFQ